MSQIQEENGRKWTGVTETFQLHSEAVQAARKPVQVAYDGAQGNNGATRNSALLAAIESEAAQRQNRQSGVHVEPTVPTVGG